MAKQPTRGDAAALRKASFQTSSGIPLPDVEDAGGLPGFDPQRELGRPGEPPFTRGPYASMHRGKLWTRRQFAGFGDPEQSNERFRYLLSQGQTGLSVAFDLPTLMGLDSDAEAALGEVGKCGVAIDSVRDMERLFHNIDLAQVSVSMTVNGPAAVIWAMYLVVAERRGVPLDRLAGTLQNDILKEYLAQKEYLFPPRPAMRLVVDTIEFATAALPRFHPLSISGYHIREAGATALGELALTLRDGIEYVEWTLERGLPVDAFAPRLSFFFNAHNELWEEVAKFRAARKLWYRVMSERFSAREARSLALRFHAQTSGVTLTAQQPYNNLVRVAVQALAAVLGGAQSLHTNALDEALALPTEAAATLALRTQQILAEETGVADVADPCGGAYLIERLTRELEQRAWNEFARFDGLGGMVIAIEQGVPQREIADAAFRQQRELATGDRLQVGVNAFQAPEVPVPTQARDETVAARQRERLAELRRERSAAAVERALRDLRHVAAQTPAGRGNQPLAAANLMPPLLAAVRAEATLGEICQALRDIFGDWQEPADL